MEVDGYIPQIYDPGLTYPLISCDISEVPECQLGFLVAEDDNIDNYNLIYDVPFEHEVEGPDGRRERRRVFDIVKHWPYGGHGW